MDRKILIIGPSWVGDMVMAQSLFITLQQRQPCRIDVLAPAWSRPLLARMPEVSEALELPFRHGELSMRERYQLGVSLRQRGYDQVILLPNSFKSALVPLFARIPLRTGWRGEMRGLVLNDSRKLDREALPLMVQRFVALGLPPGAALPRPCPWPQLGSDAEAIAATLAALGVPAVLSSEPRPSSVKRRLVLCPGAEFGEAKQWPAAHYAALAQKAVAGGWQVVIVGSANDRAIATQIRQQLDGAAQEVCFNLAGQTSLDQVIDVLASADAVVSNDSGLMHIAAALQRPLVAVYGSTSAAFTPPLAAAAKVQIMSTDIECRPCFQRRCPLGHKRCLTELMPDTVWAAVDRVMKPPRIAGE